MKSEFERSLLRLMAVNERIAFLTADEESSELAEIFRRFPERSYKFGIAECNLVGAAAGFAKIGLIPVVYTYGAFLLYRAYDFIRCDVCINEYNVKFVGWGSGVKINNYGPTHHTTEDIALVRVLPNIVLLSPASVNEVEPVLQASVEHSGPVYMRIGKAFETEVFDGKPRFEIGRNALVRTGTSMTFIATGNIIANAIAAAVELEKKGVTSDIISMSSIKPLDRDSIVASIRKTGRVVTLEEHQIAGGVGSAVAEIIAEEGVVCKFRRMGFQDKFATEYGWHKDILDKNSLSTQHIVEAAEVLIGEA